VLTSPIGSSVAMSARSAALLVSTLWPPAWNYG
jgi:hypothetical protein